MSLITNGSPDKCDFIMYKAGSLEVDFSSSIIAYFCGLGDTTTCSSSTAALAQTLS